MCTSKYVFVRICRSACCPLGRLLLVTWYQVLVTPPINTILVVVNLVLLQSLSYTEVIECLRLSFFINEDFRRKGSHI